ncbi:helix-turn-helix domain-containing protein [Neobacillus notoginsengisoli]|uniref:Helix-turn-helix domain-containing protein n=1 Tax=Neobacillus notoginsengisoli TaxID=1578198 RepID=A0A417YQN9_9BACI|nr:helix-turn-helix domain-containing protein [Neobacillus notoginsengisoli]RHW36061.1 helix-turn-helix domain-containing protein [Neobacillus notoginsengisoli]
MEKETDKIISTNDAAELLNVKPSTIHRYVKQGKLKPVYEENWHIDTTKLFYKEDILSLKKQLTKPGITTGEAAELLGVHLTTIALYIKQGDLKAEKKLYRGREINFISPEELERFKSEHIESRKKRRKEFYDKETGFAWFQSFKDRKGNTNNRILLDDNEQPYLATGDGKRIALNQIHKKGYKPVTPILDKPYKTKRGFAKFSFKEDELFYQVIEFFYKHLGPKNMKVKKKQGNILVDVKPDFIPEILDEKIYNFLSESITSGEAIKRLDGILINSNLEIISVAAPSELKQRIKDEAEERRISMEDLVIEILNNYYDL